MEVFEHLYKGAAYYVYQALGANRLNLMQVAYTTDYKVLPDDHNLPYNVRTYAGHISFILQILDRDTHNEALKPPWPAPATYVDSVDPMEWYDIDGNSCDPDTD